MNTEEVLVHKLHIACEAHYYDVAWGLIYEFGADVNALFCLLGTVEAHEKSPLYRVCSSHNYAEVELPTADFALKLMQRGADINYICADTTPLQMSLCRGRWDIARELLLRGASGKAPSHSSEGQPLDILLCLRYDPDISLAESIIANGGDINAMCVNGFSPLHSAAMRGDCPSILEYFISKGAAVNHPGHGDRPLYIAAVASYCPCPEYTRDEFEQCVMRNVRCLLTHGAHLNATTTEGRTALHTAYAMGNFAVAKQLERAGATALRDLNGNLPRQYTKQQQLREYRERCWVRRRSFVLFLRGHGLLRGAGGEGVASSSASTRTGTRTSTSTGSSSTRSTRSSSRAVRAGASAGVGGLPVSPVFRMLVARDVQSHVLSFL